MLAVDDCGWLVGAVSPLAPSQAYSLLAPDAGARIDAARWAQHARTFFRASLEVAPEKRYPSGGAPLADAATVRIAPLGDPAAATSVAVTSLPLDRAPSARKAALAAAWAIGGAGFDVLVARGKQLWQVDAAIQPGGDARAPLVVAAVLASVLLAPIVPPDGAVIFGVKGARERLDALGWRS